MSDILEAVLMFGAPATIAGVGVLVGEMLSRPRGTNPTGTAESRISPAGGLIVMMALMTGLIGATRVAVGQWVRAQPVNDSHWIVWVGVIGALVGLLHLVTRRWTVGLLLIAGAIGLAVLTIEIGLATASKTQFGEGVARKVLMYALCGVAMVVPWVWVSSAAGRWPVTPRRMGVVWLVVPVAAVLASVPGMFYSRFMSHTNLLGAVGGMGVALVVAGSVWPRRGVEQVLIGICVPLLSFAWLSAHFYAEAPWLSAVLGIAAPIVGLQGALMMRPRGFWPAVVAGVLGASIAAGVAGYLARQANHHPTDIIGMAGQEGSQSRRGG